MELLLILPLFYFVPKFLNPLTPVKCFYGIHDYIFQSRADGQSMEITRTEKGLKVSFRGIDYYRCSGCGNHIRKLAPKNKTDAEAVLKNDI